VKDITYGGNAPTRLTWPVLKHLLAVNSTVAPATLVRGAWTRKRERVDQESAALAERVATHLSPIRFVTSGTLCTQFRYQNTVHVIKH